jgi:hypothetical protein
MAVARFRFYEELNDFLAPDRRKREFELRCAENATVKNAIESVGVPHTEVELILADGESVDFAHRVQEGERISVYPMFESFDIAPLLRLRRAPLRDPRFIADAQLGGLARWLRMLGFDTAFEQRGPDAEIRRRALEEHRTILTRDRQLLICRDVSHGCYVHALEPTEQLREIVARLQLGAWVRPFSRCLCCNEPLQPVTKREVIEQLPPSVAEVRHHFMRCTLCRRVYWQGDHYQRMRAALHGLLEQDLPADALGR